MIFIKILIIFTKVEKFILKFIWDLKIPGMVKIIMKNKNKVGHLTLTDFKSYYTAKVTRTM
jgi:hypothetical protein